MSHEPHDHDHLSDPAAAAAGAAVDALLFALAGRSLGAGGSVHLHCTDVAGEWTLRESAEGTDVTREHAKCDCAIRGSAAAILGALQGSGSLADCDVVGDPAVAERFIRAVAR